MGNRKDPLAGLVDGKHVTNSSPILDVKPVTLALKCPSCEKPFNVCANLTAITETAAAATATAEMGFNAAGANIPVHENRKLQSDNKTQNKGQLKVVVAASAARNYTPPKTVGKRRRAYDSDSKSAGKRRRAYDSESDSDSKSAGKRRRAYDSESDSDSKDDPPSSKKSKVVNRHLKFNN